MTVCIGAICDNGEKVIIVSDAMITGEHLSIQFEHKTPKIIPLSNNCAIATAGDALAHTELCTLTRDKIEELRAPSVSKIVESVKQCYKTLRKREIIERVLEPRGFSGFEDFYQAQRVLNPDITMGIQNQIDKYDLNLFILVGGVDSSGAHIYGVFDPGTSVSFDALGYHAIGTGYPHAITSFISKSYDQTTPLNRALFTSYEAKKISEKAPGVGDKITNVCIITNGKVRMLKEDEVRELEKVYQMRVNAEMEWDHNKDWAKELETLVDSLSRELS